jgi:NAD(P)-dependent dehydrogenase (short-subunit alcohol dehydrogenase family)
MDIGMQERKVALITGSSSGIGFETALILARTGIHTYATMRNLQKSKNIIEIAALLHKLLSYLSGLVDQAMFS